VPPCQGPNLALARLTQHLLEKLTILKLVLDGVAVVAAWLLQELLKVVIVALSLAHSVSRCNCVGVVATSVPPLLLVLCRGGALVLLRTLGLSYGLAIGEDYPDRLLA
jgi:hypothetical protein